MIPPYLVAVWLVGCRADDDAALPDVVTPEIVAPKGQKAGAFVPSDFEPDLPEREEEPDQLTVDVVWTARHPASHMRLAVRDPEGRTRWRLGIAETGAGSRGWYGEDCFLGLGTQLMCHVFEGAALELHGVRNPVHAVGGQATLLQSDMQLTYLLQHAESDACWVWGHDVRYYAPLDCAPLPAGKTTWARRAGCSGMDPADTAPLGNRVALTFDDGPDPVHTPLVMATLRKHGAPATFFLVGERIADPAGWGIVEDIVADPLFDAANHSWDHPDHAKLTRAEVDRQIVETEALLKTFGAEPTFYRFPYGSSSCRSADQARQHGYRVSGWHVDSADWCYAFHRGTCPTEAYWRVPARFETDMVGFVMHQVQRFGGGVILFHDIHAYTARQLDAVLTELTVQGFTFARLSDATAFPLQNAGTPHDYPWVGERCDPRHDRCWEVELNAHCEPLATTTEGSLQTTGVCTVPCVDACIDRDGTAPLWCAQVPPPQAGQPGDVPSGRCLAQAVPLNEDCAGLPGTQPFELVRHDGADATARVCAPESWLQEFQLLPP